MDIKEAIKAAKNYAAELFSAEGGRDFTLEEVELREHVWRITVGFADLARNEWKDEVCCVGLSSQLILSGYGGGCTLIRQAQPGTRFSRFWTRFVLALDALIYCVMTYLLLGLGMVA